MSRKAVLIAGSPSAPSRSTAVLDDFGRKLALRGFAVDHHSLDRFNLEDLVRGRVESESVARFLHDVQGASGIVFSTPVYKATYAGVLKLIIDLIAPTALEGRALIAIATARLEPHLAQVDESFQRLYRFFKGSIPLPSLGLLDTQIVTAPELALDDVGRAAFESALDRFSEAAR